MTVTKEKMKELFYKMLQTRHFEEKAARLFTEGKVHGTAHFCIGEEATGIGVCSALEKEDYVAQTHRGHNQAIGKGMDINRMMAEFLGKATGYCKGKGGCMHIADSSVGSLGANGIVGGGIPIAVGAALKQKMRKEKNITVGFFGDGATNEGSFHESLNLASVWKLPVLFVCTNNTYGMSTHISRSMNITDISIRAKSYGIKGLALDGNDVLLIYNETLNAKEHILKNGPMFMVLNTYRIMGHSKSDANVYRTRDEIEAWKEKCPIRRFRTYLLGQGTFTEKELDEMDRQAALDIEKAYQFAEESPEPSLASALEDVYA
ncbi:MAG: thiamine pyrophosphate-dependent dehydrogenase E1 component subunit alpha [Spirochaetales bacterium]|nr:MAG: thiamine pyrophosphate-dependent dehydrogenase E1 component subunit alpha [Spirochaetales bacterium]